jgi:hypothetical protein
VQVVVHLSRSSRTQRRGVSFVQPSLGATAMIAAHCDAHWGVCSCTKQATLRKRLRESIRIDDASPLLRSAMRNTTSTSTNDSTAGGRNQRAIITSMNVGPLEMFGPLGKEEISLLRQNDSVTTQAFFWGNTFNVGEIVAEVNRLLP